MESYVIINGMHSYEDLELLLKSMIIPSNNEEYEEVKVEGRSGSLIVRKGTYKNKKLNFTFDLKRKKNEDYVDFQSRVDYIEELLSFNTGKLIVFNRPNKEFNIKYMMKEINIVIMILDLRYLAENLIHLQ